MAPRETGAWLGLKTRFSCSYSAWAASAFTRTPSSSRYSAELFHVRCARFGVLTCIQHTMEETSWCENWPAEGCFALGPDRSVGFRAIFGLAASTSV